MKTIGIIGAGAIGCSLGSRLFKTYGDDFCLIAQGPRAERLAREGITVNGETMRPRVCSKQTGGTVDLLLLCVKNYNLEEALRDIAPAVAPHTVILPLLNGVMAVRQVRRAYPDNVVPYGIVLRTDAERISENVTVSTHGEIQIGFGKGEPIPIDLKQIYDLFDRAGLKPHIYPDMRYMQWRKWMINIGSNQVSVLTGAKFKYFGQFQEIIDAVRMAIDEILEISRYYDVGLTQQDVEDVIHHLVNFPPEKKTSMLQDIEARRHTEIDDFAGTVIRLGREAGVPTPINDLLYLLIKAKEKVGITEKWLEESTKQTEAREKRQN